MAGQTPKQADADGRSGSPSLESLLHLVDRAEKGTILAAEAVALRAGLRAWASELAQAQRLRQQLGVAPATPEAGSKPQEPS